MPWWYRVQPAPPLVAGPVPTAGTPPRQPGRQAGRQIPRQPRPAGAPAAPRRAVPAGRGPARQAGAVRD